MAQVDKGLKVSRGGLCRAMARLADKAEPTYQARVEQIRGSPIVTPDETEWKVGAQLWWMWVLRGPQVTVYAIQPGRGFEQAAAVLGVDFAGFLVRRVLGSGSLEVIVGLEFGSVFNGSIARTLNGPGPMRV